MKKYIYRIEFDFILEELKKKIQSEWRYFAGFPSQVRQVCLDALTSNIQDTKILEEVKKILIQKSIDISVKKPRYFKNSLQHRLKLRIAIALAVLYRKESLRFWDARLLNTVFEENNQIDVTMIAERVIATTIPKDVLLDLARKLPTMTPSAQVTYHFSFHFIN